MKFSDSEIFQTVEKVQQSTPEFLQLSEEYKYVASLIAKVTTKSTVELLNRDMLTSISVENTSGFPVVFAEWAQQFNLKTHFDKFCAIMAYYRDHQSCHAVTTADIAIRYDKARWKKPKNMADVFSKGAERILFTESDEGGSDEGLKQWVLTRTGYEYLMNLKVEV